MAEYQFGESSYRRKDSWNKTPSGAYRQLINFQRSLVAH